MKTATELTQAEHAEVQSILNDVVDHICGRIMARMLIWGEDFSTAQEAIIDEIRNDAPSA